jgi:hypothetical protein
VNSLPTGKVCAIVERRLPRRPPMTTLTPVPMAPPGPSAGRNSRETCRREWKRRKLAMPGLQVLQRPKGMTPRGGL